MIAAPFLIQFFFTMCALPAAAMMISAFRQIFSGFFVRECTTVTVQSFFISINAAGMPTMFDRPTTTALAPLNVTPLRSNNTTHPFGVHGMNRGSWPFMDSLPMFSGWNPSTSFSIVISAKIFSSFMCLGNGSCTKMPWHSGSALKSATTFNTSSSVDSSGISLWKETIPASSHALRFILTYVALSGRLPTITTASPGTLPYFSFKAVTSSLISPRIAAAMALPSITLEASGLLLWPPIVERSACLCDEKR
mmetsp:Transcript_4243/g.15655  ORF Transcript_4243/g.15655 Transcript_4243/m.15655 type:complete len:251 (+) Transcript_4243:283-1035(+)